MTKRIILIMLIIFVLCLSGCKSTVDLDNTPTVTVTPSPVEDEDKAEVTAEPTQTEGYVTDLSLSEYPTAEQLGYATVDGVPNLTKEDVYDKETGAIDNDLLGVYYAGHTEIYAKEHCFDNVYLYSYKTYDITDDFAQAILGFNGYLDNGAMDSEFLDGLSDETMDYITAWLDEYMGMKPEETYNGQFHKLAFYQILIPARWGILEGYNSGIGIGKYDYGTRYASPDIYCDDSEKYIFTYGDPAIQNLPRTMFRYDDTNVFYLDGEKYILAQGYITYLDGELKPEDITVNMLYIMKGYYGAEEFNHQIYLEAHNHFYKKLSDIQSYNRDLFKSVQACNEEVTVGDFDTSVRSLFENFGNDNDMTLFTMKFVNAFKSSEGKATVNYSLSVDSFGEFSIYDKVESVTFNSPDGYTVASIGSDTDGYKGRSLTFSITDNEVVEGDEDYNKKILKAGKQINNITVTFNMKDGAKYNLHFGDFVFHRMLTAFDLQMNGK